MSERGHYPVSSTAGYGKRAFDKERRETHFDFKARKNSSTLYVILDPGPGSYRSPSDFGQYDGGNVYKNTGGIAYMSRTTQLKSLNSSMKSSRNKL